MSGRENPSYPPVNLPMKILQKDLDTALSIAVDSRLDEAQTRVVRLLLSRNTCDGFLTSDTCTQHLANVTSDTCTQHLARFYVLASSGNEDQAKEALMMAHDSAARCSSAVQANAAGSAVSDVALPATETAANLSTSSTTQGSKNFSSWAALSLLCESRQNPAYVCQNSVQMCAIKTYC